MIVAVFNQSGGVGKSTLTRDLGYELHTRGLKTLLIDADPQGTLGFFFGIYPHGCPKTEMFWSGICGSEDPGQPPIARAKCGISLGLANKTLVADEILLMQQHDPARLLSVLEPLKETYDFILIDCPPRISELTIQILFATDGLLIPVQTEAKSVMMVSEIQEEIARAQRRRKNLKLPQLKILGVVPTLYNPQRVLHRHHLQEIKETVCDHLGYHLFPAIRDLISLAEAGTKAVPLKLYDPKCSVNEDIAQIAAIIAGHVKPKTSLREVVNG
jgi:chromosome partitioning protein